MKAIKIIKNKGFTLVELLTVVAILGIISSIVLPNISGSKPKGRDVERVTEVSQIALALEQYYSACRQYPSSEPLNTANSNGCPTGVTLATYLDSVPTDPLNAGAHVYTYNVYGAGNSSFVIRARLEDNRSALNNDVDGTLDGTDCTDTAAGWFFCKKG